MGRRRSVRPETPLRRSSRLRGIHQALEETEDVTFEFVESQTISDDEDGEKVTTEKKESAEELRKTVRPATSRIPTFQSSVGRKRPTGNSTESSFSAKMETSIPQAQTRERDSVGGETSRVKIPLYNSKDTAIPVPAVRMPFVSADEHSRVDLSQVDLGVTSVHLKRNSSPDLDAGDSGTSLHRPALRADLGSYDAEVESQFISGDSSPVVVQENLDTDPGGEVMTDSSSTTSPSDGQAPALTLKLESSNTGQGTDEERMYETEALELSKNVTVSLTHKMETDSTTEDEGSQDESTDEKMEEEIAGEVCNEGPIQTESDSERDKSAVPESKQDTLTNWKTDAEETEPEMKPKASVKPVSQSSGSHCPSAKTKGSSFMWFCLVPSLLLVLGGFGQHVWLYGVPQSVSHLMAQLELHWLEGFLPPPEACSSDCSLTLVESIPEGLQFPPGSPQLPSISQSWGRLLNRANRSVTIAAFYLTLRDLDLSGAKPSAAQGEKVFRQLMELESRGVKLQVAVNAPQTSSADTDELVATGAEVRAVNLQGVTGGIVHTKLWVVDNTHMYVGSANMDWRSLSQVKEIGVTVEDCSCLAQDASRIFGVYWDIGAQKNGSLPPYWPGRFSALSSSKHPLVVKFNGVPARAYLSSSPPSLSAYGRSDDLSTILSVIADAKQFIYVSVMDYLPFSQYIKPLRFWPVIDTALREAACVRGVEVRLLLSCWAHSPGAMFVFAQSLAVLSRPPLGCSVSVKVFEVPSTPEQLHIPYARVNHAKYMVTDRVVYIGTSNWSENYFTQTAGVGLVVNQTGLEVGKDQQTVQSQLQGVFQRDWASGFAQTLTDQHTECVQRRRPVA